MKIFYDSYCPLCCAEMSHIKKRDQHDRIQLVDIQDPAFSEHYPRLDKAQLDARIHVELDNGEMVSGLDATHAAWQAVGRGWLYAPLRWPVIRIVADMAYNLFARNRYTISYLLTGRRRTCDDGQCGYRTDK